MRLRRFTGCDPTAALRRVKEALGPDAIILGTRPCDEGVEITAAVDLDALDDEEGMGLADTAVAPSLHDELAEITRELRTLGARVARIEPATAGTASGRRLGGESRAMAERLVLHGMGAPLATRVARGFQKGRSAGDPPEAALGASLARHLAISEPGPGRRVQAFVGPTGCGKTTTIAKLAAAAEQAGATRLAFVMADTHRIGATAQLEAYARLLGARMEIAESAQTLATALEHLVDYDAVFIDTAGVGGDAAGVRDLRAMLAGLGAEAGVTAVVSTGLSQGALERAWRRMEPLAPRECIVTKVDESPGFGATCSWAVDAGLRVRWLGIGQRVPGDLTEASGEALSEWGGRGATAPLLRAPGGLWSTQTQHSDHHGRAL